MGCRRCCNRSLCTVGQNSCRGQRHGLFTECTAQIQQTEQAFITLVPFRQCSAPCSEPLPCAVPSMEGRAGASGVCCSLPGAAEVLPELVYRARFLCLCGFISSQPGISLGFQGLPCPDHWGEHDFSPRGWGIAASVVHLHNSRFGNAEMGELQGSTRRADLASNACRG